MGKKKSGTEDFDVLRKNLSVDEDDYEERYEFIWPGKRKAIAEAYRPAGVRLCSCEEKSLNWEETENIYIEGENLAALKLLQEEYFEKIKMIYIDPPYNTRSDLIFKDNFTLDAKSYRASRGAMTKVSGKESDAESKGRRHALWCSMIYSRLLVARNLLTPEGAIFISIDDNEVANLKKICEEIFGEENCVGEIIRKTKSMTADKNSGFNLQHEYLLIYAKDKDKLILRGEPKAFDNYSNPDDDPNGDWCSGDPSAKSGGMSTYFEIENPYTGRKDLPPKGRYWAFSKDTMNRYIIEGKIKFKQTHRENERGFVFKRYKKDAQSMFEPVHSLFAAENEYMNQAATIEVKKLFGDSLFSYPKPVAFIKKLVQYATDEDSIVLDFFSGSGTTAQAVMEQNASDGGRRKFIMVQLQEKIDKKRAAYKAGYETLCDLGRERIRLAAENISEQIDKGYKTYTLEDEEL